MTPDQEAIDEDVQAPPLVAHLNKVISRVKELAPAAAQPTEQTPEGPIEPAEPTERYQSSGSFLRPVIVSGSGVVAKDLGGGYRIISQKTKGGVISGVSIIDSTRPMVWVEDSQGRGSWFYQSFAGTSGKQQGVWFPVGGLAENNVGLPWIVKGDPKTDPFYGRPELKPMFDYVNTVLPHSNTEVEELVDELAGEKVVWAEEKFEAQPLFKSDNKGDILNAWKNEFLNPVWGGREKVIIILF